MLTKIKTKTMGLGSRTLAFFRKGDELEATRFETLPHDDPTLVPPKLGFSGFDKIPRNRAPLVIAVVLIAVAALGVFGRRSVRNIVDQMAGVVGARQSTP